MLITICLIKLNVRAAGKEIYHKPAERTKFLQKRVKEQKSPKLEILLLPSGHRGRRPLEARRVFRTLRSAARALPLDPTTF